MLSALSSTFNLDHNGYLSNDLPRGLDRSLLHSALLFLLNTGTCLGVSAAPALDDGTHIIWLLTGSTATPL